MSANRSRLTEIDALRGMGALAVMLFHYTTRFHALFPAAPHVPFAFLAGNYRVLLFFAISGFAIFFTLDRIRTGTDFLVNRVSRLYPAYWVAMAMTLCFEYAAHVTRLQIPAFAAVANLSMLEGFAFLPAVDGSYWTLTVEIGFYVSMFLIWRAGGLARLEAIIICWLMAKIALAWWPGMPERLVMVTILRFIPFFAIGMLSYRVWSGQRRWRQQVLPFGAVLITVGVLESPDLLFAAGMLIAVFAALIAGKLRWLAVPPLLWVGGISYSLYLVHQNIGFVVMLMLGAAGVDPWVAMAAAMSLSILLAWGVNRLVERPMHRLADRWWRHHGQGWSVVRAAA